MIFVIILIICDRNWLHVVLIIQAYWFRSFVHQNESTLWQKLNTKPWKNEKSFIIQPEGSAKQWLIQSKSCWFHLKVIRAFIAPIQFSNHASLWARAWFSSSYLHLHCEIAALCIAIVSLSHTMLLLTSCLIQESIHNMCTWSAL